MRGGKRPGAGRPKGSVTSEETKVIRVPVTLLKEVENLVKREGGGQPLYSSRVAAGFPSPADDHLQDRLDLNSHLVKNPISTFFVEASGDSMIGAGIQSGDILVVDKSLKASHGKVAIIFYNGDFTVKRLVFSQGKLSSLAPENPDYSPIEVSEGDEVQVWGIVTYVIHNV